MPRFSSMSQLRMVEKIAEAHRKEAERALSPKPVRRRASAAHCQIAGAHAAQGRLRGASQFVVVACDERGAQLSAGGDRFRVSSSGPSNLRASILDKGDGTYVVSYFAVVGGTYQLSLVCNGEAVADTPLTINVPLGGLNDSPACAACCSIEGDHATLGLLREDSSFCVVVRDAEGVRLPQGGDRVRVTSQGTAPLRCNVHDEDDGTYTVIYRAAVSGSYRLMVSCNGEIVGGGPVRLVVPPSAEQLAAESRIRTIKKSISACELRRDATAG